MDIIQLHLHLLQLPRHLRNEAQGFVAPREGLPKVQLLVELSKKLEVILNTTVPSKPVRRSAQPGAHQKAYVLHELKLLQRLHRRRLEIRMRTRRATMTV